MPRQLQTDDATFTVSEADLDIPDADETVTYTLRSLTTAKWREIKRANTKPKPNKQTRQMEQVTDEEHFSDDLIDYIIAGWTGIVDAGAPAACTRENKLRLDGTLKTALVGRAGLTQIVQEPEQQAQSFRPTADVG